ncbi:uncharacterized protein LOC62_06G008120 [Vanrija pseudolonga]|uniref:BSD domain-containing protein n=1 Tax=Vanrija pseudolonga TaxID=143232 RepID=A0AAF1BNP3_9TREE|nr:hypothetical protein LOC62_06G008120 [Vanrija pseudolonga]
MEQAPALTMSDKTQPPTREATPGPTADAAAAAKPADAAAATDAAPATDGGDAATTAARSSADTIRPAEGAAPRTPLNGLYSGSLEEEVGQVMKGLGSFWGGLKKKSWSTYTTLKEDAEKTIGQLQEEAKQLSNTKVEIVAKDEAEWEAEQAEEAEKKRIKAEVERAQREAEAAVKDKGKGKEVDAPSSPTRTTAILDRLSTSTTQFQSTFQTTINNTLAAAKANPALADPAALRAKLAENLHLSSARENLTLSFQQAEKLAEEYLKKGGALVKDVQTKGGELVKDVQTKGETWVKDAEQWVEENVKLVAPPEEGQTFVSMGGWDGGDFYSFSTSSPTTETESRTPRASLSSAAIAGSRKEALLRRLREDKDLLMVDPAGEAETQERRDEFANWVRDSWPTAQTAGREAEEVHVRAIRMALVPEVLADEQFWQRYLFHRDMIEAADTKRKLLLQASQEQESNDDFNWDDEDDDDESKASEKEKPARPESATPTDKGAKTPAAAAAAAADTPVAAKAAVPAAVVPAAPASKSSAGTSPRDSEESFDVVSDPRTATATEDDDDSDWE